MSDFYDLLHEGTALRLPRVTSILRVIDRSAPLMGWATRVEREAFRAALEEALTAPGELQASQVLSRVERTLTGKRAWVKSRDAAADIGRAAHAVIHWHTQRMLGHDPGPEPAGPDPSLRAVVAWLDWCGAHDFVPLMAERTVYCPYCGYAGTVDTVAKVDGRLLVVDYKTAKAVYDEHHLQLRAYEHALRREGIEVEGGLVLRLPKLETDPAFEAVPVQDIPHSVFRAALHLWKWQRKMAGDETGSQSIGKCEVTG